MDDLRSNTARGWLFTQRHLCRQSLARPDLTPWEVAEGGAPWRGPAHAPSIAAAATLTALVLLAGCAGREGGAVAGGGERQLPESPSYLRVVRSGDGRGVGGPDATSRAWIERVDLPSSAQGTRVSTLTEGIDAAFDPDVAVDGRRFLFVGQMGHPSHWTLYEQDLATGTRHPLYESTHRIGSPRYVWASAVAFLATPADGGDQVAVHVLKTPGARPQRITFHPGNDRSMAVAADGRIVVASTETTSLLAVRPDGTGVWSWHEDHDAHAQGLDILRWDSVLSGLVVRSADGAGHLVPASRHYDALEPLPAPSAEHPDWVPIRKRAPTAHEPSLVNPAADSGELFCMDARPPAAVGPTGTAPAGAYRLRAYVDALNGPSSTPAGARDFPLAADGSFYLKVPSDRPIRLSVVDGSGRIVAAMKSHFWLRPGEQRGCIGCHEHRGQAPPNRVILALDAQPGKVLP